MTFNQRPKIAAPFGAGSPQESSSAEELELYGPWTGAVGNAAKVCAASGSLQSPGPAEL
eukprot:CAMPEP_0170152800 /NCGR_PEP_ID=MMETSP0033_2-20121228/53577_1 /TAXON_ID=195969 /ORGANISM="Dolichomastix tenuilepis, Strain CCMP3274" /LENGTH=58 /DNA_ID=CAMNT_0010389971 /DNA_START=221 /DNA_END=394 /DNA_ORIENTATION=+